MLHIIIAAGILVCAFQAVRVKRLLTSALWLAGCSALVSLMLYLLGAPEIAVIELSVGAGLVTVLFVFAINIAGDEAIDIRTLVPRPLSWALVIVSVALLGWMMLPQLDVSAPVLGVAVGISQSLWHDRSVDVLLQVVLIFTGVLGILGLLSEPADTKDHHEEAKS